jgi:hypothetical protein
VVGADIVVHIVRRPLRLRNAPQSQQAGKEKTRQRTEAMAPQPGEKPDVAEC